MKPAWSQITAALVVGFLLGGWFGVAQGRKQARPWARASDEQKQERMLKRFSDELKLNDIQQAEVKKVLESTHEQTQALRAEIRPRYKAVRNEMRQVIRGLLDEKQRARFDEMEAEWDARKEKRWGGRKDDSA